MVHFVSTLGFLLAAAGSAAVIWIMLFENRVAILAALGVAPQVPALPVSARRISVRPARPASVPARQQAPARRAA